MKNLVLALIAILGIVVVSSVFVIPEGERGIVIRFGKILQGNTLTMCHISKNMLSYKFDMFCKQTVKSSHN